MGRTTIVGAAALGLALALAAACASSKGSGGFAPPAGADAAADTSTPVPEGGFPPLGDASFGDDGGSVGNQPVEPTGPTTDFPSPIFDGTAPMSSATLFGPPSQGAPTSSPCLVEPESDVVYPQNWLRPRFRWTAANGENLFELRLHVANQINDLVVYTSNLSWTMPKTMWDALRAHSPTEAMTLTIRGGVLSGTTLAGESLGTQTTMGIAPVQATGAVVYWTTNDMSTGTSELKGFSPGDESVTSVLSPTQYAQGQQTTSFCIGCHSSTPDGDYVAFTTTTAAQATWGDALANIQADAGAGAVGAAPSYVTSAGSAALARPNVGAAAFSPAHWSAGDRRAVVSFDNGNSATNIVLSWIDLEATSAAQASGTIARTGDSQLAGAPAFSHDGKTIVYVSTNRVCTGRLGNCTPQYTAPPDVGSRAAVYTVPYSGGAGGAATGVPGASDPSVQNYYPSFSPDDKWIVYNRIPNDTNMYDQPAAEVFVIPTAGGTATRLAANDPPQCASTPSPGITNSWAKWGPTALQANGSTYYWVVFSSKRQGGQAQLYMTSVVQAADGSLTTHGAIYMWNQPSTEANHTPAWDTFKVPPVGPVQ